METSICGANHAVLHAQNDTWGLGPIETLNSGYNVAVVKAQNHRWGLGPIETCNSDQKSAVLHGKPTDKGWDPVILMLIALFCMHKSTGEVWVPYRLVILFQKSLFYMQKPQLVILLLLTLFCMHKMTGEVWDPYFTSLYWSQTSPVDLCMQNNVISIRIISLYWSQPWSVVFACKTSTFGSELQVSIGPRPHLSFCAIKTACLPPE